MTTTAVTLRLERTNQAEASKYARELKEHIRTAAPDIEVRIDREDPEAQDTGSLLIMFVSHTLVLAATEGIKTWWEIRKHTDVNLVVHLPDGSKFDLAHDSTAVASKINEGITRSNSVHGTKST